MPKRKNPEIGKKEQFERFIETARIVGVEESGKTLDEAFKKIAAKRPKAKQPPKP